MTQHHHIVIIGGGSGGLTVAAHLRERDNPPEVTVIEPSAKHYYQPIWTLVGGGVFPKEVSERNQKDFIPDGVNWIQDKVASFDPDHHRVTLASGDSITYDFLVVAGGIQIDWNKIPGLAENIGTHGICSNYSYDTVGYTWECIRSFRGGNAVFTQPNTPIKCGGAPQKIMYLAEDHFRRTGIRDRANVMFFPPSDKMFAVAKYNATLTGICADRDIDVHFKRNLLELHADKKEAVFQKLDGEGTETINYDMIHVTPPMSAPDFIKSSPLANEGGWVDVDKDTLQHVRFPNVFALGDCSSLPTSKTGAAIRKQAPVLVDNLMASRQGQAFTSAYDGYTSCPLVTGYGKLVLAEFDYAGQPQESFPFDQSQERYSMYALKAYGLPEIYWHGMLRGRV